MCFFVLGYKYLNFRFKFNTHIPASILYTRDLSHILNFSSIFVSFFKGHTREPKFCVRVTCHYLSQKKMHNFFDNNYSILITSPNTTQEMFDLELHFTLKII
jgi:hypothetical protein